MRDKRTPAGLEFDEEKHIYTKDGKVLPSVTQCLPDPPEDVMLNKAFWDKTELGIRVHKACHVLNQKGTLEQEDFDKIRIQEKDEPYIDAWISFVLDNNVDIEESELFVFSDKFGYAGTLDSICIEDGVRVMTDIKCTAEIHPWVCLQTAGYTAAYNEMYPDKKILHRQCVQLRPDGTYKRVRYSVNLLAYETSVFLAKLSSLRWDQKHIKDGGTDEWLLET